ncbi:centrosomal protein CCDC61-like isoform X2 [Watersipora subatra]|uniref:centrosomal protein CCDC61-like isoform X2 n=1 Tax=Watersipora subatra TaxID=2589382 RepID=UPI00355BCD68
MPEKTSLQGAYNFRGTEYVINMIVKGDSLLTVTVEDRLTANQWKGSFDAAYIEDMTHKTGNYKQFHIFVNMLESAISQTSDSVTMDLLTFGDLELLRKRKAGVGTHSIPGANNSSLTQKRYLILTYAVEFDKIHYPLPLPYAGKPDPEVLQETIRRLQAEVKALRAQDSKDYRIRELDKLKAAFEELSREKQNVEQEYILYRKELKHTAAGATTKEIRVLKGVVKNLEEELMKEKAKHQRATAKKRKECQDLHEEVQELRVAERTLKVRVKSLTNELAVYKRKAIAVEHSQPMARQGRADRQRNSVSSFSRDRSTSRDRGRPASRDRGRPASRDRARPASQERGRSASLERPRSVERRTSSRYGTPSSRLTSPLNRRTTPYDRRPSPYTRELKNADIRTRSSLGRTPSPGHSCRPSPAGTRKPRFDPTAYIAEKKRQQSTRSRSSPGMYNEKHNSGSGRLRPVRSSPAQADYRCSSNIYRGRSRERTVNHVSRGRTSSVESLGSVGSARRSSNSYYSDGNMSDGSQKGSRSNSRRGRNVGWESDTPSEHRYVTKSTPNTSTPNAQRLKSSGHISLEATDYLDHSADIDDIDARLQRIQDMMKGGI